MPRLRSIIRKPEDSENVPADQAVDVVVSDESKEPVTVDTQPEQVSAPPPSPVKDEEDNSLQKQLDDLKKAEATVRDQLAAEQRRRTEAERLANQHQQEATKYRGDAEQGQYDAVLNALGAVQAEVEAAQRDYEAALARGDFATAGQAQRRMARGESRIDRLEEGKTLIEQQRERPRQEPQRQQIQDPVDNFINNLNGLSNQERDWLRNHRDAITDQAKYARIQAAYYDALENGLRRDTPEYFNFLEERLGYAKKKEHIEEDERISDRRPTLVSAPPSRESVSLSTGRSQNQRVTLSPEQREAAKISGISEVEYAKQLIKMHESGQDSKAKGFGR